MSAIAYFIDLFCWIDRSAPHIVRVFETDQRGLRIVISLRANHRYNLLPGEKAIFRSRHAGHATGNRGHGRQLIQIGVAAFLTNYFVTMVGPYFDGDEVSHAAGGDEQRSLFAKN